ncbi:sensor domain-containing diguanylate cyclase [Saccharopolyspora pogona]|uniref:sensor domain-containing diguanylate cyclase n=1 Tax=Saccharopolyspora pogona TaxID=333966 RepID=UPI001CC24D4E|nr:sensor domain-containing diguanylate cyclase [Saccharopolyspora pogona]
MTNSSSQWQLLLDRAASPMALLDPCGHFVHANDALCAVLGYGRDSLLDRPLDDFTVGEVRGDGAVVDRRFRRSDASTLWMRQSTSPILDPDGEPGLLLSQFHEIADHPETNVLWCRVFANAPIGMALLDLDGRWTDVNDAWCDLLGYSRHEMLGMRYSDVTYAQDQEHGSAALADLVEGKLPTVSLKKRYRHKDGHPIWVLVRTSVVTGADDRPAYLVSQCEELSERCVTDAHLAHLALHDPLTGLANRALLADRLAHVLAELERAGGVVAVLVADLDELKPVNDTYGHAAGDLLLTTTADELLNAARPGDTVARIGGDEFAVISTHPDVRAAEEFRDHVAQRLRTERETPDYRLRIRASVGLATTADPATQPAALLHDADQDMYRRKLGMRGTAGEAPSCPSCQCREEVRAEPPDDVPQAAPRLR